MKKLNLFIIISLLTIAGCKETIVNPVQEKDYREYVAVITQSRTEEPVIEIVKNELRDEITWTRLGAGVYRGSYNGVFPEGTICTISSTGERYFTFKRGSEHSLDLFAYSYKTNTYADGIPGLTIKVQLYE